MATHSRILAWEIPWTEEPGRLQSVGSQRVRHDSVTEDPSFRQNCGEVVFLVLSPDPFCSIVSSMDGSPSFLSPHTLLFSEEFHLAKSFFLVK